MELLLTKLQIHDFTANDLIDCIVLLAGHGLRTNAPRVINDSYIADTMRKDWGFYYTAKASLKKVGDPLTGLPGASRECSRAACGTVSAGVSAAPGDR